MNRLIVRNCGQILSKLNISNRPANTNTRLTRPNNMSMSSTTSRVAILSESQSTSRHQLQSNSSRFVCMRIQKSPHSVSRRSYSPIVDEGAGTHIPTPFQQKVLVWEKFYPSLDKVPERVTKGQMKKALDKFRVRCSILMIAVTLVAAAVMVAIGRSEREQGKSVTKMNLQKYEKSS